MISIILCTSNHAESLSKTLASIGRCILPPGLTAELLIVDNASTDATAAVIRQSAIFNMTVRYLTEPKPGQSRAINRALSESSGDVLILTDDDVRVPENWIEGMCRPILRDEADAVAGGVVFSPELDRKTRVARSWFASTETIRTTAPDRCVGANMAISRAVLSQVPAFDTELGPGALGFGGETLFCYQLRQAGFRLTTRFEIAVEHNFDPSRLSRPNMLEAARRMGRCKAYVNYHWHHQEPAAGWGELIRLQFLLGLRRLWHWRRCSNGDQPPMWELKMLEKIELCRQTMRESARPRHYEEHGLVRMTGDEQLVR